MTKAGFFKIWMAFVIVFVSTSTFFTGNVLAAAQVNFARDISLVNYQYGSSNPNTVADAFDDNMGTKWSGTLADYSSEYCAVDFINPVTINRVVISEDKSAGTTSSFSITYMDGADGQWKTAYTGTSIGGASSPTTIVFNAVYAKRIAVDYASGTGHPSLYEFKAYNYKGAYTWDFKADAEDCNSWCWNISGLSASNGFLTGTSTADAFCFRTADNLGVDLNNNKIIKIRMKNYWDNGVTPSSAGKIYFITTADTTYDEAKHKDFSMYTYISDRVVEYIIDMSDIPGWQGTMRQLRIDPGNKSNNTFSIAAIEITDNKTPAIPSTSPSPARALDVGYLMDDEFATDSSKTPSGWYIDSSGCSVIPSWGYGLGLWDYNNSSSISMRKYFLRQSYTITMEYKFYIYSSEYDGLSWELCSGDTAGVKVYTSGSNLCYENSSGQAVILQSYDGGDQDRYGIKVVANITAKKANIYVNGILRASNVDFRNTGVSYLDNVRISTPVNGSGTEGLEFVKIYKGYDLNECFITTEKGSMPGDWTVSVPSGSYASVKGTNTSYPPQDVLALLLDDNNSSSIVSATYNFPAGLTGTKVFEYKFMLPVKVDNMQVSMLSTGTAAVKIVTNNGNLCYENSSGTKTTLLSNYYANIWYDVKIIAKVATNKADIFVNGRKLADNVDFRNQVGSINKITVSTAAASGDMWFDNIKVYSPITYGSVPQPVPVSTGNYLVGAHYMPGWKEGNHLGWDTIAGYPERKPSLGWYDEGSPEVADWEIKWALEHGINFFTYDWFRPSVAGETIKDPIYAHPIHDGLFNATYSNLFKFNILWENSSGAGISSYSDLMNNLLPYWIEHYFKHPSYLKVGSGNDIPVLNVFNPYNFIIQIGDADGNGQSSTDPFSSIAQQDAAYAISQMKQACINAGLGGLLVISEYSGTNSSDLQMIGQAGFDFVMAYAWTSTGANMPDASAIQLQKDNLNAQRSAGYINVIPTICMGWNNDPLSGYGFNDMTETYRLAPSSFQTLASWVKDTFIPPQIDNTGKRMVMCANWNEYGEGHYIAPHKQYGFGYLDAIRNVFYGTGSHTDAVPSGTFDILYHKGW